MAKKFVIWDDTTKLLGVASSFRRQWIRDFFSAPFWDNIPDKPSVFPPEEHNHDDRYYTKTQLQTSGQAQVHWNNITNKPSTYPPSPHDHDDRYYTKSQLQTSGKAQVHWDNITNKPSTYPPSSHTHTISEITDIANASVNYANSAGNADKVDGEHASAFTHARNGGKNIWVQSSAPTAQAVGDIWIQTE